MNPELLARLNSYHLEDLRREAHRNRQARIALRLPSSVLGAAGTAAGNARLVEYPLPAADSSCCAVAS